MFSHKHPSTDTIGASKELTSGLGLCSPRAAHLSAWLSSRGGCDGSSGRGGLGTKTSASTGQTVRGVAILVGFASINGVSRNGNLSSSRSSVGGAESLGVSKTAGSLGGSQSTQAVIGVATDSSGSNIDSSGEQGRGEDSGLTHLGNCPTKSEQL